MRPDGDSGDGRDAATGPAEAKAAFQLHLRARGARDLDVLRAFERIPRSDFVSSACHEASARDLAIPIDCGQTLEPAWQLARMIEALDVCAEHRVLEIGTGSGYAATIVAQLAGEVVGIDRFRRLVLAAEQRLRAFGVANAALIWADGLALQADDIGVFDRIVVHALVLSPSELLPLLKAGGRLVCACSAGRGPSIVRLVERAGALEEEVICPARLQPLRRGICGAR